MMTASADADDLETRLERLALEADTCSLDEFRAMADEIRSDAEFDRGLQQAEALANEKRLLTLTLLRDRDALCACELQAALDCTNATVSHHASRLVDAGLVEPEQRGKWKYYQLTDDGRGLLDGVLP
jgi:ArsR family transcriptional regulator